MYGLLCQAKAGGRLIEVPLGECEAKKGSPNRQLLKDYRTGSGTTGDGERPCQASAISESVIPVTQLERGERTPASREKPGRSNTGSHCPHLKHTPWGGIPLPLRHVVRNCESLLSLRLFPRRSRVRYSICHEFPIYLRCVARPGEARNSETVAMRWHGSRRRRRSAPFARALQQVFCRFDPARRTPCPSSTPRRHPGGGRAGLAKQSLFGPEARLLRLPGRRAGPAGPPRPPISSSRSPRRPSPDSSTGWSDWRIGSKSSRPLLTNAGAGAADWSGDDDTGGGIAVAFGPVRFERNCAPPPCRMTPSDVSRLLFGQQGRRTLRPPRP